MATVERVVWAIYDWFVEPVWANGANEKLIAQLASMGVAVEQKSKIKVGYRHALGWHVRYGIVDQLNKLFVNAGQNIEFRAFLKEGDGPWEDQRTHRERRRAINKQKKVESANYQPRVK